MTIDRDRTDATRSFVGLGSTAADAPRRLNAGLRALCEAGERVAAVADARWSPYEEAPGRPDPLAPRVLNAVAELSGSRRDPSAMLDLLHAIEDDHLRDRSAAAAGRTLDLDLLAHGVACQPSRPSLPHPRAAARAFVLAPWEEVAPLYEIPGTRQTVVEHAASLRARRPEAFGALEGRERLCLPDAETSCRVLEDAPALGTWRAAAPGRVGLVPTMGALHAGHEALLRRARAECDRVLATLFVNPLQFGPGEDLARYPRAFEGDLALLSRAGVDAVYVPAPEDLYPPGFATAVLPEGPALGLEGAVRPGHFRGVATVVFKLLRRTDPSRAYFGRKDAQQLAVIRRMVEDLDLEVRIVACPTVRDHDGLALSSRNRYLPGEERERALALPRALEAVVSAVAAGAGSPLSEGRRRLEAADLRVDYLEIVDPDAMTPVEPEARPLLVVGAVRLGETRLLDNRWLAAVAGGGAA